MLADHTKIGNDYLARFGVLSEVDLLITDSGLNDDLVSDVEADGSPGDPRMIITLTLNPSLDRTIDVERLARGEVIRAASSHVDPGGKGVNVTRALLANGVTSRAVLTCGGEEGQHLVRLLAGRGRGSDLRPGRRPHPLQHHPRRAGRHDHEGQ